MKRVLHFQKHPLKTKHFILAFISFLILAFQGFAQQIENVNYGDDSFEDFMNPDRGFYYPYDSKATDNAPFKALDEEKLRERREDAAFTPDSQYVVDDNGNESYLPAAYKVNTSIILRHYILNDFKTNPIQPNAVKSINPILQDIKNDLETAKLAKVRVILRFSYTLSTTDNGCNHGICPPYRDSNEKTILAHIASLKDIFEKYEDVIMLVQQGFIGIWGEQYYTDYFGDASGQTNGQNGYLKNEDWNARFRVLKALLDAVPESRMVQVRYPQMRYKFLQQPETQSYAKRIGFQNDCFLSSSDDVGTYTDYDENKIWDTEGLRGYSDQYGDIVAVGGETCGTNNESHTALFYARNNCVDGGGAVEEMEKMNWSFLNSAYSYLVNNDWTINDPQNSSCIDDIKRRLGYRFVLRNGQYPKKAQTGTTVNFTLNLENVGFAAPFNERTLYMMLKKGTTYLPARPIYGSGTDADVRTWKSGDNILNLRFYIPPNTPVGDYEMHLHIADLSKDKDGEQSIKNIPEYSIRLANKLENGQDTWNADLGYNNLDHTITIQNTPPPPPPPISNNCIDIDGNFADWQDIVRLSFTNNSELSSMKVADDENYIYIHLSGTLRTHYQIFLDTDGNRSVNNNDREYLNSDWPQSGFNYMVENGTLLRYVSDNPWDWPEIGSIQQREISSGLELIVPKNLLALSSPIIYIAANTLDATWTGTAHLPAAKVIGARYELFSSNPCVEDDVCILIDGDGSDWQNISSTHSNSGSSIIELKVADNTQDLFVYIKSNVSISNHTPQIFFDVDNSSNGFKGTDWNDSGFDYMMEYDTFHKYTGDGYYWSWPKVPGEIVRNYDNNTILEFKIPKSMFQGSLGSTIRIAGYYKDSTWDDTNKILPSSGTTGINYTLNNNTCNGQVQKTENVSNTGIRAKYNLESSQALKNDGQSHKQSNQNCMAVDGNPNEWNAMGTYGYAATGSLTHIKVADNSNEILFYLEGGLDVNNQIYLNSDVNNASLNRYNLSQWEYTGFNYLIENNELFVYNGNGDNWSWSQIGTVSHSISDNVLEVVVKKSQLANLSNSIGFAATSLNIDYNETGAIPQSNAALNYLSGTKNLCNIKPACLTVNGEVDQWLNINAAAQLSNSDHLQSIKISDGSESIYILLEGYMDVYQSIFIDSDNNAVGANEYTDSNWSLTGFNYLIDEGDLFIYQGNGTSWDWKPIGAVNMITSKYWTELSVKKYLMGNISGDIQVAASSFDADWAETSFIPAAEEAVTYTPSINNLSLFFHQNGINFHQAYSVIQSSANLINSSTNEVYKAGQLIQLNNGFSSPPVTDFDAYIENCE